MEIMTRLVGRYLQHLEEPEDAKDALMLPQR